MKQAREVRSLDGYDAVVLGTPLYMGALHKDVRALLEKNRAALEHTPFALFALGPIKADDGIDGSRAQLIEALAKLPVPAPASTAVFVGAYDPARLGFKDKMIAALPASPLHGETRMMSGTGKRSALVTGTCGAPDQGDGAGALKAAPQRGPHHYECQLGVPIGVKALPVSS